MTGGAAVAPEDVLRACAIGDDVLLRVACATPSGRAAIFAVGDLTDARWTALLHAVSGDHFTSVTLLLSRFPQMALATDRIGLSTLEWTAYMLRDTCFKVIVETALQLLPAMHAAEAITADTLGRCIVLARGAARDSTAEGSGNADKVAAASVIEEIASEAAERLTAMTQLAAEGTAGHATTATARARLSLLDSTTNIPADDETLAIDHVNNISTQAVPSDATRSIRLQHLTAEQHELEQQQRQHEAALAELRRARLEQQQQEVHSQPLRVADDSSSTAFHRDRAHPPTSKQEQDSDFSFRSSTTRSPRTSSVGLLPRDSGGETFRAASPLHALQEQRERARQQRIAVVTPHRSSAGAAKDANDRPAPGALSGLQSELASLRKAVTDARTQQQASNRRDSPHRTRSPAADRQLSDREVARTERLARAIAHQQRVLRKNDEQRDRLDDPRDDNQESGNRISSKPPPSQRHEDVDVEVLVAKEERRMSLLRQQFATNRRVRHLTHAARERKYADAWETAILDRGRTDSDTGASPTPPSVGDDVDVRTAMDKDIADRQRALREVQALAAGRSDAYQAADRAAVRRLAEERARALELQDADRRAGTLRAIMRRREADEARRIQREEAKRAALAADAAARLRAPSSNGASLHAHRHEESDRLLAARKMLEAPLDMSPISRSCGDTRASNAFRHPSLRMHLQPEDAEGMIVSREEVAHRRAHYARSLRSALLSGEKTHSAVVEDDPSTSVNMTEASHVEPSPIISVAKGLSAERSTVQTLVVASSASHLRGQEFARCCEEAGHASVDFVSIAHAGGKDTMRKTVVDAIENFVSSTSSFASQGTLPGAHVLVFVGLHIFADTLRNESVPQLALTSDSSTQSVDFIFLSELTGLLMSAPATASGVFLIGDCTFDTQSEDPLTKAIELTVRAMRSHNHIGILVFGSSCAREDLHAHPPLVTTLLEQLQALRTGTPDRAMTADDAALVAHHLEKQFLADDARVLVCTEQFASNSTIF